MLTRHPYVVDILGEFVRRPLFFTIGEIEFTNRVTIEGSLVPLNQGVVAIDSHGGMIVRDRKGEDFLVKLFLALYSFVELDDTSHDNSHAVSVLSIDDVKRCSIALHLTDKKREVHSINCDEKEVIEDVVNERIELLELLVNKDRSSKLNRVVRF